MFINVPRKVCKRLRGLWRVCKKCIVRQPLDILKSECYSIYRISVADRRSVRFNIVYKDNREFGTWRLFLCIFASHGIA